MLLFTLLGTHFLMSGFVIEPRTTLRDTAVMKTTDKFRPLFVLYHFWTRSQSSNFL
jgi:hypothetical protein